MPKWFVFIYHPHRYRAQVTNYNFPSSQATVRLAFLQLLRRRSHRDPLPPDPPHNLRAPTAENFYVRWLELINSAWNRQALHVAAEYIVATFPDVFSPEEKVQAHILAKRHLQNLQELNLHSDDVSSDQSSRTEAADKLHPSSLPQCGHS